MKFGRPRFSRWLLVTGCLLLGGCDQRESPGSLEGSPPGPYRLLLELSPPEPVPGEPAELRFTLTQADSGAPVQDLQIVHERALHTFIVASDFTSFAHLHQEDLAPRSAEDVAQGVFRFPYVFPAGGTYRIFNEFTHRDRSWVKHFEFRTRNAPDGPAPQADPRPNNSVTRDGFEARLSTSPVQPVAGHEAELVLELTRAGRPVEDLELLLGAEVHVAVWRLDGAHFGHTHSYTPAMAAMMRDMAAHPGSHSAAMMIEMMSRPASLEYRGPVVPIRHTFPEPGIYQLFLQCAPAGVPRVFPFKVEVGAWREGSDTRIESRVPDA